MEYGYNVLSFELMLRVSNKILLVSLPCYTAQKSVKRDHFMVQKKADSNRNVVSFPL